MVLGEDGAPSIWYGPTNDSFTGDTVIRTIGIPYATMRTYYATINWNAGMDGGGYCGLQAHPSGREYHFAIWDPSNHQDITAVYLSPGTTAERFGGEGTGLKAMNFTLGWNTGQWYATAIRCWDVGSQDTYFGYWIHDVTGNKWTHVLTFDFPMPGIRFSYSNRGFVEDWAGTGSNIRRCHIQGGSKRNLSGTWYGMSQCRISANADTGGDYDWNFDGGVENDYYFIESGGSSTPGPAFGSGRSATFSKSQPNDPQDPAIAFSITDVTATEVSWNVPVSSTPQFGYTIKINGNQVDSAIEPEIRTVSITPNVGDTVEVILEDILGRTVSQSDTLGIPDTTPPTPDPMTWETPPYVTGVSSIAMVATTASDPSGVQYYFTCTAGNCNDSDWQDSRNYTDTSLLKPNTTTYTYTAKARDKSYNQNTTDPTAETSAITWLSADIDGNGSIGPEDVALMAARWQDSPCAGYDWCSMTDLNLSDKVDMFDLSILAGKWQYVCVPVSCYVGTIVTSTASGTFGREKCQVAVAIYDNCDISIADATVIGTFTGPFTEQVTAVTDSQGVTVLTTTGQVTDPSFTFCIDEVIHAEFTYEPTDNIETCDSY
jgi:hypothetical protein